MKRKFKKFSAMLLSVATVMSFSVNSLAAMADAFSADELRQQDIFDENGLIDKDKLDDYTDSYIENYGKEEASTSPDGKVMCNYTVRVFIKDEISDLLYKYARKDAFENATYEEYKAIREEDFAVDDCDVQLALVETDSHCEKILNTLATWNAMEEPVKDIEISCEVAPDETRYFEVMALNLPEGYVDGFLDLAKLPEVDYCIPRIQVSLEEIARQNLELGGQKGCLLCSLDIYNVDEMQRFHDLEYIYRDIYNENPIEFCNILNMVMYSVQKHHLTLLFLEMQTVTVK